MYVTMIERRRIMYIGIDLGGTNIAAGLVSDEGKILLKDSVPTGRERDAHEIVRDMAELSKKLIADHGADISEIRGVGVGCPGAVDYSAGTVVHLTNIKMDNFDLAAEFQKTLDLPVYVENDANCAALGEYVANGNGAESFVLVTLGTGVGCGIVLGGKLFRGFNGAASEAGHMTLIMDGEPCNCGKRGCWEAYASVTALIRQTKAAMEAHPESLMNKDAEERGKISGRTAFECARAGDEAAAEVVRMYTRYVADGIVSLENILQPEIISVGGGISREGEYLLGPVREYIEKVRFNRYMKKTEIVTASLHNDAGIIGAAMAARV